MMMKMVVAATRRVSASVGVLRQLHLHQRHHCRRQQVAAVALAARRQWASTFKDVYSKTVLGVVSDVRGKSIEGTVVRDSYGNTASDLKSHVPRAANAQEPTGHILVDVGLKFPVSVNCSSARMGQDREDIAVGDKVVVKLQTPEISEHLLGNSKHTTIHLGKAEFERVVVDSILTEEIADQTNTVDDDMLDVMASPSSATGAAVASGDNGASSATTNTNTSSSSSSSSSSSPSVDPLSVLLGASEGASTSSSEAHAAPNNSGSGK